MLGTTYPHTIFCPYRVCPVGAHVDHQLGLVTGFAVDRGITLEFNETSDGSIKINSKYFDGEVNFGFAALSEKESYWGTLRLVRHLL